MKSNSTKFMGPEGPAISDFLTEKTSKVKMYSTGVGLECSLFLYLISLVDGPQRLEICISVFLLNIIISIIIIIIDCC